MLFAAVPLFVSLFVFMLFSLHYDGQNLVFDQVLLVFIFWHFLIVIQVGGCHESLKKLLVYFIFLLLLCFVILIIVLAVVQFSVLAAQLTFLFNVDHLRVVDTDWSSHGLLPHDFVNKVQCMRWKLQALDRIFLGY